MFIKTWQYQTGQLRISLFGREANPLPISICNAAITETKWCDARCIRSATYSTSTVHIIWWYKIADEVVVCQFVLSFSTFGMNYITPRPVGKKWEIWLGSCKKLDARLKRCINIAASVTQDYCHAVRRCLSTRKRLDKKPEDLSYWSEYQNRVVVDVSNGLFFVVNIKHATWKANSSHAL